MKANKQESLERIITSVRSKIAKNSGGGNAGDGGGGGGVGGVGESRPARAHTRKRSKSSGEALPAPTPVSFALDGGDEAASAAGADSAGSGTDDQAAAADSEGGGPADSPLAVTTVMPSPPAASGDGSLLPGKLLSMVRKESGSKRFRRKLSDVAFLYADTTREVPRGPPPAVDPTKKFRVLSMDGGGVRCILHCIFLRRLLEKYPKLLDSVDLICAVSGSSPVACGCCLGTPIERSQKIMEYSAVKTLSKTFAYGFTGTRYDGKWLRLSAHHTFGDIKLGDLGKRLLIPAFRMEGPTPPSTSATPVMAVSPTVAVATASAAIAQTPVATSTASTEVTSDTEVQLSSPRPPQSSQTPPPDGQQQVEKSKFSLHIPFRTRAAEPPSPKHAACVELFHNIFKPNVWDDELLADICLRTAAAPAYFSAYQGYVDGGVFANNPSVCALPLLLGNSANSLGIPPSNVVLLSMGTGRASDTHYFDPALQEGGLIQWSTRVIDLFQSAQEDHNDTVCRNLLGQQYHRLTPDLPENIKLDDYRAIGQLKELAGAYPLTETEEWLRKYWFADDENDDSDEK
eukprot:TRINITY_DN2321_c0_g2_i1.p1 TRINITY_DN2321_c0_g2~~TRINITY_DN2321_c0_g2_i1.p1  ORF type:complete len:659 (-),score=188.49 TRINITY_DN2321_c0_g2_i1:50-1765(-)